MEQWLVGIWHKVSFTITDWLVATRKGRWDNNDSINTTSRKCCCMQLARSHMTCPILYEATSIFISNFDVVGSGSVEKRAFCVRAVSDQDCHHPIHHPRIGWWQSWSDCPLLSNWPRSVLEAVFRSSSVCSLSCQAANSKLGLVTRGDSPSNLRPRFRFQIHNWV